MIFGTLWSVAMRWSIKGLGLASTVVLARLLSPGDYGVVAMAMLVVGLAEVLLDFGANTALLREPNPTRDFIDSAWTLGIIQGLVMAALLAAAAPLAASYFREPRVVWVIWLIAPCVLASTFVNIGMTLARKELNFALEFRFNVTAKVFGVLVTAAAAWFLRDYRALVIGIAAGYLANVLLSFVMHPYRPRWCVASFGPMWNFSKWLLVSGIGQFAVRKIDEIVAGRIGTTAQFGAYTVGADIGQLVSYEIGPPINRTLLPTLSILHEDLDRMRMVTLKTLSVLAVVVMPLGVGMAMVADVATLVILGEKWRAAIPFVAIFSLIGLLRVIAGPVSMLLLVLGHSKLSAISIWIEFAAFAVVSAALVPVHGLIGLAYARLAGAAAIGTMLFVMGRMHVGLRFSDYARAIWRPAVGAGLMAIVLPLVANASQPPLVDLMTQVAVGAATYICWIVVSWWLVGRPDGIENMVLDRFFQRAR